MDNKPQLYQIDYWESKELLDADSIHSPYGPASEHRYHHEAMEVYFTNPPKTRFYLWFEVGVIGEDKSRSFDWWYTEVKDYCWRASGSGGASFALYLPMSVYEQLVKISTQPKDEQFMDSQLRQMLSKKPINPGSF